LVFKFIKSKYNSRSLAGHLNTIIRRYNLGDRIISIIINNASNNTIIY